METPKLLTTEMVAAMFSVKPGTIARWVAEGSFPKPIRQKHRLLWLESALVDHLAKLNEEHVEKDQ